MNKVFGIGLSRTGETSLNEALTMLGYRTHFLLAWEKIDDFLDSNDAMTHTPLALCYKELDRRFPGSKFILTVRERESWLRSCEKRWASLPTTGPKAMASAVVNEKIYGTPEFDRERFSKAYDRHVAEVQQHFTGRKDALLLLDICDGEGFDKLCPFLDKPILQEAFPRKNTVAELEGPKRKIKRFLIHYLKAGKIMELLRAKGHQ